MRCMTESHVCMYNFSTDETPVEVKDEPKSGFTERFAGLSGRTGSGWDL